MSAQHVDTERRGDGHASACGDVQVPSDGRDVDAEIDFVLWTQLDDAGDGKPL